MDKAIDELLNADTTFYSCDELEHKDIEIEFKVLGKLNFPLTYNSIQKLINISSKAKFGLDEKTLLDESIRNTHEIKSDQFTVKVSFQRMLNTMRDELGLPENSVLIPRLHNMLIYEPGHFFQMHRDTEKLENMIATLVVVLPSPHIGGNLIIKHGRREYTFSTENLLAKNLKCIAFYSDCLHRIERVKEGYRIALTFNLVLKSETPIEIGNVNKRLKDAVVEYFDKETQKLVYFLNHFYTERNLNWDMLKGEDNVIVSALDNVAKELGLVTYLALAEITRSFEPIYDHEEEVSYSCSHHRQDVELYHWIDKENRVVPLGECDITHLNFLFTKKIDDFDPIKEIETAGILGNDANDSRKLSYRRAAIVLVPSILFP